MLLSLYLRYDLPAKFLQLESLNISFDKSNSGLDGFADAVFDSFEKLKDLNNKAKAKKSDNVNELYTMQNSEEYKAAQANKKYNEEGKK